MHDYGFDFGKVWAYYPILLRGLRGTFELMGVSVCCGLTGGLFIGLMRCSRRAYCRWTARGLIEIFRNTPTFVQLIWFFYAFPILIGIQLKPFTAAACALSLNMAAYSAEIFRAGIQSIAPEQWEAGRALGMSYPLVMRRIILPQAIPLMIPPLTNQVVMLLKRTANASLIAYGELMYEGKQLINVLFCPFEVYTVVALMYLAVLYPCTRLTAWLEKRWRSGQT